LDFAPDLGMILNSKRSFKNYIEILRSLHFGGSVCIP
jgi:hypothetical protein